MASDRMIVIADRVGALCVDVDQNIHSVFQIRQHRFAYCAVKIFVHLGVLQKFVGFDSRVKIRRRNKSVILAVNLAGTRRSRRARNRIKEIWIFAQSLDERGLSRARWSGNDEENALPAELATQGFAPARESSPSRPCSQSRVARSSRLPLWLHARSALDDSPR